MTLYEDLLRTEVPDRPYFLGDLKRYFPRPLRRRFDDAIEGHRLRREIIATWVANSLVNRGLEVFVSELEDETGADLVSITLAYAIARDAFQLIPLWGEIEALGPAVAASHQLEMLVTARDALFRGTRWFLAQAARPLAVRDAMARFEPGIATVVRQLDAVLSPDHARQFTAAVADWTAAGVSGELARRLATLPYLVSACDIVALGEAGGDPIPAARIYYALDADLRVSELEHRITAMPVVSRWDRMAFAGLQDELSHVLRRLTAAAARSGVGGDDPVSACGSVQQWLGDNRHGLDRYRQLSGELATSADVSLPVLSVVTRAFSDLGRAI